jgi:hypothetical protein
VRCDEIEDTEQQIYKCKEAKKMWTLYYRIIGKIGLQECKIFNFEDIVLSRKEDTEQIEILKATIIKHNIQINRPTFNRNLLLQQLLANIELECKIRTKNHREWQELINVLKRELNEV